MPDFSKSKIYTIRCKNDDTKIYVGSTTQPLSHRWGGHKKSSKKNPEWLIYKTINNDFDNWYIELYELHPCKNKEELGKREGEVIREIGTLNSRIEGRTKQEYHIDNRAVISDKKKQYWNENRIDLMEKKKQYIKNNQDKIKEQRKQRYINNAEEIKEKAKQYRIDNKVVINERRRVNNLRKKAEQQ